MAKHNWKTLEKEFILSDFKSVNSFLESKNIAVNGNTKKQTKGWKDKKVLKEDKKSTKIVEKVIEKEAEIEAQNIIDIKKIANKLASKIDEATEELNTYVVRNKKKSKTIEYNYDVGKPSKEIIYEDENIETALGNIDRLGLKQLTSALKDINDVLTVKNSDDDETLKKLDRLIGDIDNEAKQ